MAVPRYRTRGLWGRPGGRRERRWPAIKGCAMAAEPEPQKTPRSVCIVVFGASGGKRQEGRAAAGNRHQGPGGCARGAARRCASRGNGRRCSRRRWTRCWGGRAEGGDGGGSRGRPRANNTMKRGFALSRFLRLLPPLPHPPPHPMPAHRTHAAAARPGLLRARRGAHCRQPAEARLLAPPLVEQREGANGQLCAQHRAHGVTAGGSHEAVRGGAVGERLCLGGLLVLLWAWGRGETRSVR